MERWEGKVAVVTGASAGIGAAIAKDLVSRGMKVVGVARRVERVEAIASGLSGAKGKLYPFKGDVSSESDVKALFQYVRKEFGAVHVLVNNAGAAREVPMTGAANYDHMRLIFGTNVFGLFMCTSEALDLMKEKGINDGHIIHMNSVAGQYIIDLPNDYLYQASKHAVTVLTEGLRRELVALNSGIRVTSINPGYVDTEMAEASGMTEVMESLADAPMLDAKEISEGVMYVLSVPQNVQIHDLTIRPVGEKF